jgi:hypothetical protein
MTNDLRPTRYSANEIRFNLMAVIKDRKLIFEEQIEELLRSKEVCTWAAVGAPGGKGFVAVRVFQEGKKVL